MVPEGEGRPVNGFLRLFATTTYYLILTRSRAYRAALVKRASELQVPALSTKGALYAVPGRRRREPTARGRKWHVASKPEA